MRVVVVTPPEPVVTLGQAKLHLRVDSDDESTLIEGMVAAATAHIDGPDGWLGRAIGVQTLEARFDGGTRAARLPFPPIVEVEQVRRSDGEAAMTWTPFTDFELIGDTVYAASAWDGTRNAAGEAVSITYRAGYETVPAPIIAAILLMTEDLYRNRGNVRGGQVERVNMPVASEHLLAPYRVYS